MYLDTLSIATKPAGLTLPRLTPTHQGQLTPKISQEVTCDSVDLFSLLGKCARRDTVLYVGTTGKNTDRFLPAMVQELYHIANHGSAYCDHFFSLCVKTYRVEGEGAIKVICAVVTDGLTIGHWRSSASSVQLEDLAHCQGTLPLNGPCLNLLPEVTS
ncbi:uncharacterized protein MELLADRAFT_92155 [Melampsora larici-populina 98AG31]|uniref:Uncharacterized protein n=1 Tax=Melampsora larici-populina (strain 98AG31 / pathotype 3-4-7) TaxID=747676 RepID=F4S1P9_MELLP|nr:uncharacterized protein MELLADRAFT_92155 [Melampsora larici-populina 98AG31]EGG01414.1 hypothetical protein MELLADRAFT_92155 [Melampsora larici-populina 98AG31]